jgi:hypothetical protein
VAVHERGEQRRLKIEAGVAGRQGSRWVVGGGPGLSRPQDVEDGRALVLGLGSRLGLGRRERLGGFGLVLNGGGLGRRPGLEERALLGDAELELLLGLGGTVQLLVDSLVLVVEGDVGAGRVGVPLDEDLVGGRDVEKLADLTEEAV